MTHSSSPAASLDVNGKGLGAFPEACTTADVAALNWNLLAEDVSLPVAVLYEARVRHNLQWCSASWKRIASSWRRTARPP